MKTFRVAALAALLLGAAGVGAAVQETAPPAAQGRFISEYKIGPRDQLEIKVINGDKFNTLARVAEDGRISIPFLGAVEVDGLTASELEAKLVKILEEKYLRDPQVSVVIKEFQSKRVSVLGAVRTPGSYELLGRQTLLQIISKAGGLTKEAAREILVVRRAPDGAASALKIPIDALFARGEMKWDIPLEAGDILNVQVDREVKIYVMGQVKNPGALSVLESRIPTVTQAIAQAGGFTERAAESRVVVKRRGEDGAERDFRVDVGAILKNKIRDFPLQEGDTVYVPQSLF